MVPTTNIISGLQELCKEVKFSFHEMKEYSVLFANEGKVYCLLHKGRLVESSV